MERTACVVPSAPVVVEEGVITPVPETTLHVTTTPGTGRALASVTTTTNGLGSTEATWAVC